MFTKTMDIRFSDQDSQGHVHHEAIVGYMAHARVEFLDELIAKLAEGEDNRLDHDLLDHILVHLNVDFLQDIPLPKVAS